MLGCFTLLLTEADKLKLLQLEHKTTIWLRVWLHLSYFFYCLLKIHLVCLDQVGCNERGTCAGILEATGVIVFAYPWSKTFWPIFTVCLIRLTTDCKWREMFSLTLSETATILYLNCLKMLTDRLHPGTWA
jgi:hypothetical protein